MKKLNEILGTKYPFIQGGMANIATGEFAAACSNAGALGMIATGGWDGDRLRQEIRRAKELTEMCIRDSIRAVADGLGLDYTLEKITDDDVIDRMDLLMPCLYAYCPGCRVLNEQVTSEHPETLCTPALEINGTLRFWGVPASDDALRQALSSL